VNVAKAIAAYVAALRCGPGRLDRWLDGDDAALTESELRGAALFAGKGRCTSCHSGPNLTDGQFHNAGLAPAIVAVTFIDRDDRGAALGLAELAGDPLSTTGPYSDGERIAVPTVTATHEGAFRTPTLRCISRQPSYMHTGQLRTLEQVVAFKSRGGDRAGQYPGTSELTRLDLTDAEQADLVAFLGTLEGAGPEAQLLEAPAR
jgi:cytochrome c peroxidase